MEALVLGGTRFLGRHIVEACLAKGHTVTIFDRQESAPNGNRHCFPRCMRATRKPAERWAQHCFSRALAVAIQPSRALGYMGVRPLAFSKRALLTRKE